MNANSPRKNDPITCRGIFVGVVASVEKNICFVKDENGDVDCLNKLHSWPGKEAQQSLLLQIGE